MTGALPPRQVGGGREVRLLCLPYAGASAQIFRSWCQWLAPRVEVLSLELPGRGFRVRERPAERIEDLVAALAAAATPWLDRPLALFGHGVGALVAFELARRFAAGAHPPLQHLFVSAQRAPQLPPRPERLHALPDAQFLAGLEAWRGAPAAPLADLREEPAAEFLLPALRADVKLMESYEYRPGPELDVPITVFGGIEDHSVSRPDLEAWSQLTRRACVLRWLPAQHFFVHEHQRLVAANLLRALHMPAAADPSPRALETLGFVTV
jgi:medium-chain acyl-[acyl-carrier-protein] hydrolase